MIRKYKKINTDKKENKYIKRQISKIDVINTYTHTHGYRCARACECTCACICMSMRIFVSMYSGIQLHARAFVFVCIIG